MEQISTVSPEDPHFEQHSDFTFELNENRNHVGRFSDNTEKSENSYSTSNLNLVFNQKIYSCTFIIQRLHKIQHL